MGQAEAGTQVCWNHPSFSLSGCLGHSQASLGLLLFHLVLFIGILVAILFQGQVQMSKVKDSQGADVAWVGG